MKDFFREGYFCMSLVIIELSNLMEYYQCIMCIKYKSEKVSNDIGIVERYLLYPFVVQVSIRFLNNSYLTNYGQNVHLWTF
jgi:hypothetical protein